MKNNIFKIASLCSLIMTTSCVDIDTTPYDTDTDLTFWGKPNAAEIAINTCYPWLTNPHEIFYKDAMSDNAYSNKSDASYPAFIGNGTFTVEDGFMRGVWSGRYGGIRLCNKVLDNIDKVPGLSETLKKQYIGEAKVLRAISYYELVIRFGDIPYFTHTLTIPESQSIGRTPKETVINNILAELQEVLDNDMLPESYDANNLGRITKWGAMGMIARIHLSQNNWTELEKVTKQFMQDSGCELCSTYEEIFSPDNENSKEVIIDVQYARSVREHSNVLDMMPPTMGGYCVVAPLQSLVDDYIMLNGKQRTDDGSGWTLAHEFENSDPRLASTIVYHGHSYPGGSPIDTESGRDQAFTNGGATPTGYYTRKYYDYNLVAGGNGSGLNIIYLRYADILLMYAEAMAEQNKLTEEVWNKTIRPLRVRAGFTEAGALDFPSSKSKEELIDIVRRERRCELALEGLRYTDIIRWRIAEDVLNGNALGKYTGESGSIMMNGYRIIEKRKFDKNKHYLWPVPEAERLLNKNLGQNSNW